MDSHSWSAVKIDRNGIRFFHEHVLKAPMPWIDMVKPPVIQSLPDVLARDEIARIIRATHVRRTGWHAGDAIRDGEQASAPFNILLRGGTNPLDHTALMPDGPSVSGVPASWLREKYACTTNRSATPNLCAELFPI